MSTSPTQEPPKTQLQIYIQPFFIFSDYIHTYLFAFPERYTCAQFDQCPGENGINSLPSPCFLQPTSLHHSPPTRPHNSYTTPATHHSLSNTVGCVNIAHSHTHTERGQLGSSGFLVLAWRSKPTASHNSEPLATLEPSRQSITWL